MESFNRDFSRLSFGEFAVWVIRTTEKLIPSLFIPDATRKGQVRPANAYFLANKYKGVKFLIRIKRVPEIFSSLFIFYFSV